MDIKKEATRILAEGAIWEVIETIGEHLGLLSVTRDSSGKVMKRNFLGIGWKDEILYLIGIFQTMTTSGWINLEDLDSLKKFVPMVLETIRELLTDPERVAIKNIIGFREQERVKIKEEIPQRHGKNGKKPEPIIKSTMEYGNFDGEKILLLFAAIIKIGEEKKSGSGKEELVIFLRSTVLNSFEKKMQTVFKNVDAIFTKFLDKIGIDEEQREIEIIRAGNRIDKKRLKLLLLKAKRKGVKPEELL